RFVKSTLWGDIRPPFGLASRSCCAPHQILSYSSKVPRDTGSYSMPDQIQPAWVTGGLEDLGFHETGDNQGIEVFIAQARCGSLGDPWCAIWTNAKLEQSGIRGTRSASSQSFRDNENFVEIDGPALGAIVVFWRGSPNSGLGHVGFYMGETETQILTL